jgi:hypothetical protein
MKERFESARRPSAGLAHFAFDYLEVRFPPDDIFTAEYRRCTLPHFFWARTLKN